MDILNVTASKNYQVFITDSFNGVKDKILPLIKGENVLILTDEKVDELYYAQVADNFSQKKVFKYVIGASEDSKNFDNYYKILNFLCENAFDRKDTIIALGGGVVSDLAGFLASTFMRGISFITIPTTILSAVDASVGGKTAINMPQGKNLVGAFYQPSAVYINVETFGSLPDKEKRSGLGEIIKYLFIDNRLTVQDVLKNDIKKVIFKCLTIKSDIVSQDERESNIRKLLNFGHTIGHAVEILSNFKISHGECVAIGIDYAIDISQKYYKLDLDTTNRLKSAILLLKNRQNVSFSKEQILSAIKHDKKRFGDSVDFILVKDLGKAEIVNIKIDELGNLL